MPSSLRSGATTSCGCIHSEMVCAKNELNAKHGHAKNGTTTPEYKAWQAMLNRCYRVKDARYKWYGAKGVIVCDRWRNSFEAFIEDIGLRPSKLHSLDRFPNPAGNYEPGNVRWATSKEQGRNLRDTVRYAFHDENLTIGEISERTGVPQQRIYQRITKYNWTAEQAVLPRSSAPVTRELVYKRWYQMVSRCTDPSHDRYADYGGRGIKVHTAWMDFDRFIADVGMPASRDLTFDRFPNNDGHYEPGNFRWATYQEQNTNRRNTKFFTLEGETKTLNEWAELAGIDYSRVKSRMHNGWSLDEALGTPIGNMGRAPKDTRRKWTEHK